MPQAQLTAKEIAYLSRPGKPAAGDFDDKIMPSPILKHGAIRPLPRNCGELDGAFVKIDGQRVCTGHRFKSVNCARGATGMLGAVGVD